MKPTRGRVPQSGTPPSLPPAAPGRYRPAAENREVMLDGDRALRLEDTHVALTAMVDRGERIGARRTGPIDLIETHRVPHVTSDTSAGHPPLQVVGNLEPACRSHRFCLVA